MSDASCFDCGLAYGSDGWADYIIPDVTWLFIAPIDGCDGLLCVTCMIRRLNRKGIYNVEGKFTSGPFALEPDSARENT